ncbi:MAG: hypothetical protein ACOY82_13430 [Pseudomonadota bacterium]
MQGLIGRVCSALLVAAAAVAPSQVFAQSCSTSTAYYGVLMQVADLDGNGSLEAVCNGYSEIAVVAGNGTATRYPISNVYWTQSVIDNVDSAPGAEIVLGQAPHLTVIQHYSRSKFSQYIGPNFTIAVGAVSDMDGVAGKEIPIENGSNLVIYGRSAILRTVWIAPNSNWKVCTEIANCASDMNGTTGAELLLALPSEVKIYSMASGGLSSYWIGNQYATLSNGVRDFDGVAGNDIAIARADGMLHVLRPRSGYLQSISGAGTFGSTWTLVGYANLDGVAGDEIRIRSNTNNRIYRVYPRTGSVVAE